MDITHNQLKAFYAEAFKNGANANLVCGGLSSNNKPTTSEVYTTLIKAFTEVKKTNNLKDK